MRNNTIGIAPLLGGFAALALLLFVPDAVQAQDEPKLLTACYVPKSGVVYRIKAPGLRDDCRGKKKGKGAHVEFSWAELAVADGTVNIEGGLDVAGGIHLDGKLTLGNTITIDDATNSITSTSGTISFDDENLVTTGTIESASGGFKFPDGTTQITAAAGGGGAGWNLSGNSGTTAGTNFLGTTDNVALEFHVNGARALRLEPHPSSPNVIGGFIGNGVTAGVLGATIGGGGLGSQVNRVTAFLGTVGGGSANTAGRRATVAGGVNNTAGAGFSTVAGGGSNNATGGASAIGGGQENTASNTQATVGGGLANTASGNSSTVGGGGGNTASASFATVGGGASNDASAPSATVAGGDRNTASGTGHSTVGGGLQNTASGSFSTVPGGVNNTAAGALGFAAGQQAKANHNGTFVWADATFTDFASTGVNQFLIRASGGVGIGTASPGAKLHLANGAAGFTPSTATELAIESSGITRIEVMSPANGSGAILFGSPTEADRGFITYDHANDIMLLGSGGGTKMVVDDNGNVGIGRTDPQDRLEVFGGNIRVTGGSFIDDGTTLNVPDYVFEEDYSLMTLDELRAYIAREKHLPNVPSAEDIEKHGLNLSQFQMRLLEKIEELTLYILAQQEQIEALKIQVRE